MPAPTLPVTSGLVTRYHAGTAVFSDTGATTPATDGGDVALWQDQVGTAHLTVKSGADAPTFEAASPYNAAPAVEFDAASGQALANAAWNSSSNVAAGTLVVFWQRDQLSQDQGIVSPTSNVLGLYDEAGGLYAGISAPSGHRAIAPTAGYHGQLSIVRFDGSLGSDAARLKLRTNKVNRSLTFTGTTSTVTATVAAGLRVGMSFYDAAGSNYATCRIMEILYYSRALTDAECVSLETYAATQYFPTGTSKVHCIGDSKTRGFPLPADDVKNYPNKLDGLLPSGWTVANRSTTAYKTAQVDGAHRANTVADRDEWRDADVVAWMTGTNDAAELDTTGDTEADVLADLVAPVTGLHAVGFRVHVATIDGFDVSGTGQPTSQVDVDAFLAAFNADIVAGDSGADHVIGVADAAAFSDHADTIFYNADGVHWTATAGVNETPSGNDAMAVLVYNALIADGQLAADPITPPEPSDGTTTTDPSEVSGLELWYKTETLSALSDLATVTTWPDSSGNAVDAAAGGSPVYKLDTVNGRPSVALTNLASAGTRIGWFNVTTTVLAAQPITLFYLLRYRNANFGKIADSLGGMRSVVEGVYAGTGTDSNILVYAGSGPNTATDILPGQSTWFLLVVRMRGVDTQVRANDAVNFETSVGTNGFGNGLVIGGEFGGGSVAFYGDVAEFAAYSADLTDQEVADLYNGYWQPRFNLPPNPTAGAPAFAPAADTYATTQSVTLTTTTSGADIRYTVDGSEPTSTTGTAYSGPITVPATATIKAIAYKAGILDSAVISRTYTISSGGGVIPKVVHFYRRMRAG